jgi:ankyrin repeat protein
MKKIDLLIKAAGENRLLDLVELINDVDVDVNEANDNQLTALMQASTYGHASAVEVLLQAGAILEEHDSKVFSSKQLAELFGHKRVLEVLNQYGTAPRKNDKLKPAPTPEKLTKELFAAIKENDANKLTKMIGLGAKFNTINSDNRSPLMLAVKNKQSDCLRVLIANGAEIDLANKYGYTALMFAAWYGRLEAVQFLVENGANIEFQTNGGATALMEAATNAQLEVMRYLIEMGATIDAQDKYGETALMKAVKRGHDINVINYLINHGASISLPNKYGETALQIAKIEGHDEISEYLKTIGSSVTEDYSSFEKEAPVNFPEINDSGFADEDLKNSGINQKSTFDALEVKDDVSLGGSAETDINTVERCFTHSSRLARSM